MTRRLVQCLTIALCSRVASAWGFFGRENSSGSSLSASPTTLQLDLLARSAEVRPLVGDNPPSYKDRLDKVLYVDSSFYAKQDHLRGFCNWIVPGYIMIGQYPGQTPETGGPSQEEVRKHIQRMTQEHRISLFCSLQSEIPSQNDEAAWNADEGMVFLEPQSVRRQFPHPFTHYAPVVKEFCPEKPTFLHCPIEDLNAPDTLEPLECLLRDLLDYLSKDKGAVYLHCWGGRGRGGLVGACLLSLVWPSLSSEEILDWVQAGYATRLGHDKMPCALSRSPQTSVQKEYVKSFVQNIQNWQQKTTS